MPFQLLSQFPQSKQLKQGHKVNQQASHRLQQLTQPPSLPLVNKFSLPLNVMRQLVHHHSRVDMHYPINAHRSIFKISLICLFIPLIWLQVNKYKAKQDCNHKALTNPSLSILLETSQCSRSFLAKCKLSQRIQVLLLSKQRCYKGLRVSFSPASNLLLPSMCLSNQKCSRHLNTPHRFTLCMQVCSLL